MNFALGLIDTPFDHLFSYTFAGMKADYDISNATWLSMTKELVVYQVHTDLYPDIHGGTREILLREILNRHGINQHNLKDPNDTIFRKASESYTLSSPCLTTAYRHCHDSFL